MKKYILAFFIFIIVLSVNNVAYSAKSLSITNIDTTLFPKVKCDFFIFDNDFQPISNYSLSDFLLLDNKDTIKIDNLNCPTQNPINNVSYILTFDLAISTNDSTHSHSTFAKKIFDSLIENIDFNKCEAAMTAFDISSYLEQDFTQDKSKLIYALNNLSSQTGSIYDEGLLSAPTGAISISDIAKYSKSLIVITDGIGNISSDSIIKLCQSKGIKVFWLMIGNNLQYNIKQISKNTGGLWFDKIDSNSNIQLIIKTIQAMSFNYVPCQLEWTHELNCQSTRSMELIMKIDSIDFKFSYGVPIINMPRLELSPAYLGFSAVLAGKTKNLDVYITAREKDATITKFILNSPFSIVSGDVGSVPIVLKKDSTHKMTIMFSPTDSAMVYTVMEIITDACSGNELIITGGFPNTPPKQRTLKLLNPVCGENLICGDTTIIKWKGLLPSDVIQLEYTTDNGTNWISLASDVTGLEYKWIVPNIQSKLCLVRAVQLWPNNVGQTLNFIHKDGVNSAVFNQNGDLVITACNDNNVRLWNSNTSQLYLSMTGHTQPVLWASFDISANYAVSASEDSTIIIWKIATDYKSATIKNVLKGHHNIVRSANISPDRKQVISAGADGMAILWDFDKGTPIDTICNNESLPLWCANFSQDSNSKYIIVSGYGGKVFIYDRKTYALLQTFYTGRSAEPMSFVALNPDQSKIAATSWFGRGIVWNVATGKELFVVKHTDSTKALNCANFDYSGKFLLTCGNDNNAFLWDAETGAMLMPLTEHTGAVKTVMFNFDASRVLTASMDSTAKVWNLNKRDLQTDTTDCPFSISKPDILSYDIDFGKVKVNGILDSTILVFIKNLSIFPVDINSIYIDGINQNDFLIKDGFAPYQIDSGASSSIAIRFQPSLVGVRNAKINIIIPGDTITHNLTGTGLEPNIQVMNNYIDFGKIQLGDFIDTTIDVLIKNISTTKTVKITNIQISGPDYEHFDIINGKTSFSLAPGEGQNMTLRFTPEFIERTNSHITIEFDDLGSPVYIYLFGEGIAPIIDTAIISIQSCNAAPGNTFQSKIKLNYISSASIPNQLKGIKTYLKFNASLIEPLDENYSSSIIDNYRIMTIDLPINITSDSTLATLNFKAALGNDTISELKLENTIPIGLSKIAIKEVSGLFTLSGICSQGGLRLLDFDSKISLSDAIPNPGTDNIEINFELIESGYTRLIVTDPIGNVIAIPCNSILEKGKHIININASSLSNGIYYYSLLTPSHYLHKKFEIRK